jgi:hypothetical protein
MYKSKCNSCGVEYNEPPYPPHFYQGQGKTTAEWTCRQCMINMFGRFFDRRYEKFGKYSDLKIPSNTQISDRITPLKPKHWKGTQEQYDDYYQYM